MVSIGIDQSYDRVGISIFEDKKKRLIKSLDLSKVKSKVEKRIVVKKELIKIFEFCKSKSSNVICIIERIRLFSRGYINMDYIQGIGALNAVITDLAFEYSIPVYSVDTRSWKAQVVGTSKPEANNYGVPDEKWPTIKWCIKNGWEEDLLILIEGRKQKGTFIRRDLRYMYDNDAADSAGLAFFAFTNNEDKMKLED